ncbi:MAG: hypothetical protein ACI841_004422, partial [Planctomycetota bacterium]
PGQDEDELMELVRSQGEAAAWRGDPENHKRLALGGGLELRLDREPGQDFWTMLPHYQVSQRLRVAVESVESVPDSPFDALLTGWAGPPRPGEDAGHLSHPDQPGAFRMTAWLNDARRLPRTVHAGHVLAVSIAGFALEVSYVGPNLGARDPAILERPSESWIAPLGSQDSPGGCCDVSLKVRSIRHLRNPITGRTIDMVVTDSPERPLELFLSPWQLESYGLPMPRPGWRIEGTFLFSGRVAGGLPPPPKRVQRVFG